MQIVDMDGILDDVVAEVVRRAVGHSALDAAAGHPDGETARMMIATVIVGRQLALAIHGAAELTAPNDQRVVQQAALLQILHQRGRRLIGVAGTVRGSASAASRAGPSRGGRAG